VLNLIQFYVLINVKRLSKAHTNMWKLVEYAMACGPYVEALGSDD